MGRRVAALAPDYGFALSAAVIEPGAPQNGQAASQVLADPRWGTVQLSDAPQQALAQADIAIDFALATDFLKRLQAAVDHRLAFVCGNTGLDDTDHQAMQRAGEQIPVLWAPNMSTGVNVLLHLIEQAAQLLGDYEVEIHELHHRHKPDAPSGTAVALAQRVAQARGLAPELLRLNRGPGARQPGEVGVVANRGGDVVGEHTAYFFGPGERLELVHRATDRDIFVHGALRAAQWILKQPAGLYTMADMLDEELAHAKI